MPALLYITNVLHQILTLYIKFYLYETYTQTYKRLKRFMTQLFQLVRFNFHILLPIFSCPIYFRLRAENARSYSHTINILQWWTPNDKWKWILSPPYKYILYMYFNGKHLSLELGSFTISLIYQMLIYSLILTIQTCIESFKCAWSCVRYIDSSSSTT